MKNQTLSSKIKENNLISTPELIKILTKSDEIINYKAKNLSDFAPQVNIDTSNKKEVDKAYWSIKKWQMGLEPIFPRVHEATECIYMGEIHDMEKSYLNSNQEKFKDSLQKLINSIYRNIDFLE